jgi:hypothetical protein
MGHKAMAWRIKAALASASGLRALGSLMVLCPMALWFVLPLAGPALLDALGWDSRLWPKGFPSGGFSPNGGWRQAAVLMAMLCCEVAGFWLVAMGFKAQASMAGWEQKAFSHQEADALESSVSSSNNPRRPSKRL